MGIISRIVFYIVVATIFVGDLILLIFQEAWGLVSGIKLLFLNGLKNIQQAFRNLIQDIKDYSSRLTSRKKPKKKKVQAAKVKKQATVQGLPVRVGYFVLGIMVTLIGFGLYSAYNFVDTLPSPKLIGAVNFSVSTQIYDRNGNLLYDVYRDQNRTPIKLKDLPPYVVKATLAIEDRNFYNHNGISVVGGILRAIKDTYRTGDLQGGSTITQQLVKTSLLTPERTIQRKIKEAILALWTERVYTKDQILEMYLNQVTYGGTAYGIEEAAQTYFGIPARELSLDQAALLAGLTRAPSTYSPYVNPQLAMSRKNEVLKSMVEAGYISDAQYTDEIQNVVQINPPKTFIRAPHFVFYIKSLLEQKYGIRRVEEGGLRVYTSLDLDLQDQAEQILHDELDKVQNLNVQNGAFVITAPSTGEILAMVGSKNYFEGPYGAFNVTTARRQPGSSIKPLMYSLALESQKFTAASVIQDSPVVYSIPGAPSYRPLNYDNTFHGPIPLRYALANSYNIPAVKVLNEIGVGAFVEHARKLGITTWDTPNRYGLSLTLGGAEVKLTDMAVAFGTFANYGMKVPLNPIISVEDYRGNVLEKFQMPQGERVLSEETSFILSDILSDNVARERAFGPNSALVIPGEKVAVKTGTTNDKRDNWTDGYTRKYFVGVWVGNNDNSPMNPLLTSGITGAAPIWNKIMQLTLQKNVTLIQEKPDYTFTVPSGIVTQSCHFGKIEYFISGTESRHDCNSAPLTVTPEPRSSLGVGLNSF